MSCDMTFSTNLRFFENLHCQKSLVFYDSEDDINSDDDDDDDSEENDKRPIYRVSYLRFMV